MPHSQGLKTRNGRALRAQCVQATGNISWALFLLGMMQSLLLFSDLSEWSLDLFWNFSHLTASTSSTLTSCSSLSLICLERRVWTHSISSAWNPIFSILLFLLLNSLAIHVVLPILTFSDKSMPPHYWKALANSILLKGGTFNEGVGRGSSGSLLPKAGWNHPLDSGIVRAVWKGSLYRPWSSVIVLSFTGAFLSFRSQYFCIPEPLKLQQKKKRNKQKKRKKSTFVKVYDRGQVDIRGGKLIKPFLYTLGKLFHSELKSSWGVLKPGVPACTLWWS